MNGSNELNSHIQQLLNAQNSNDEIRNNATSYIQNMLANDPINLCRLSTNVILTDNSPEAAVLFSYILIKQCSIFLMNNWGKFSEEVRSIIKKAAMRGLIAKNQAIRNFSAYSFCLVMKCDKDNFQCDITYLNQILVPILNPQFQSCATIGCLLALKELISQGVIANNDQFYEESGQKFCSVYQEIMMNPRKLDYTDFLEFLRCVPVMLPFYKMFYYNIEQRDQFLICIGDVFQNNQNLQEIHLLLYDILFVFFKCFYDDIGPNMERIFEFTSKSLTSYNYPEIILPAIIFWYDIAKFEIGLSKMLQNNYNSVKYQGIISKVAPNLTEPIFLIIRMFVTDDIESCDDMNSIDLPKSASDCLRQFSSLSPFVFNKMSELFDSLIQSEEWQNRHCALYSIWCISKNDLHNPDVTHVHCKSKKINVQVNAFYSSKFNQILKMINDEKLSICVRALSIVEVIFRMSHDIATASSCLHSFLKQVKLIHHSILQQIKNNQEIDYQSVPSEVEIQICYILITLAKQNQKNPSEGFNVIYPKLISILYIIFKRPDSLQSELGNICAEALSSMFLACKDGQKLYLVERLEEFVGLANECISVLNSSFNSMELYLRIRQCCIIIYSIVKRSGYGIAEHSRPVMQCLFKCLKLKSLVVQDEALYALSMMIDLLDKDVKEYIQPIIEIFYLSQESQNPDIIEISAGTIRRLFKTMKFEMGIYNNDIRQIMQILFSHLKNQNLFIKTRLEIFHSVGLIIKELGISAEPYFEEFAVGLTFYQNIPINPLIEEDIINASHLYTYLLKGYTGLLDACLELPYIQVYASNFKEILKIFDKICKIPQCITSYLARAILNFLQISISSIDKLCSFDRKIRILIHKGNITSLLNKIRHLNFSPEINAIVNDVFISLNKC